MATTGNSREDLLRNEMLRIDGVEPNKSNPLNKHLKMAANPFRFFRGSAQLYYADLSLGNISLPKELVVNVPLTTIVGDCHLSNFGFFTEEGAHGDTVIFAPNDFDDACIGPAAWDLLRFGVSLCLAADFGQGLVDSTYSSAEINDIAGWSAVTDDEAVAAVSVFFAAYRKTCFETTKNPELRRTALAKFENGHMLANFERKACQRAAGGKKFLKKSALAKAIDYSNDELRFRNKSDRFKRLPQKRYAEIETAFRPYVDDHILDIVERLGAGTGSENMSRFYLLVGPKAGCGPNNYRGLEDLHLCHLVEIKQQRKAAPIYHFPDASPNNSLDPAHLTVDCQRRMQRRPDIVLDDAVWQNAHWLVRSRHHARLGIDPEDVVMYRKGEGATKENQHNNIQDYANACGTALALAHARGDRRSVRFEQAIVRVLKDFEDSLLEECLKYKDRVSRDWQILADLVGH